MISLNYWIECISYATSIKEMDWQVFFILDTRKVYDSYNSQRIFF